MMEAVSQAGGSLAVLPAIAQAMDLYIARGHEHEDWTVIAKDNLTT
jgi:3-hydroxyisobutyrate dehydrogenase